MRIGTKSLLDCRSSRLVSGLSTPWALVHHHLSRLWTRLLRHPAFPLVHQLFPVRTSWYFYDLLYIFISACADRMNRSAMKYKTSSTSASLHWCDAGLGATCGGKIALWAGGRRHMLKFNLQILPGICSKLSPPHQALAHWTPGKLCLSLCPTRRPAKWLLSLRNSKMGRKV